MLAPATIGEGVLGLEALHRWVSPAPFPAVVLNDIHGGFPRYRLRRITGLRSRAESDDVREPIRGDMGELAFAATLRGRTVVYEGVIQALTLESLRAATSNLIAACSNAWREGTMTVSPHPGRGGEEFWYAAKVLSADVDDEQTRSGRTAVPSPYERGFSVSLRQSDPRYFAHQVTVAGSPGETVTVINPGSADAPPTFWVFPPITAPPRLHRLPKDPPGHDRFLQFRASDVWGDIGAGQALIVQFGGGVLGVPRVWWEGGPVDGLGRFPDLSALVAFSSTWWNENAYDILPGENQVQVTGGAWQVSFPAASW